MLMSSTPDKTTDSSQGAEWKRLVEEGNAAFQIERYSVAETTFVKALEIAEKLFEDSKGSSSVYDAADCPKVRLTKSLNNLAALYHVQGKYGLAEQLYERCLDLKLELYGEDHLETAVNLHNLAVLYSAKRTYLKAELLYKRALDIRDKLLGDSHPDLVPVLRNYALLLKKTQRMEESRVLEERASAIEALTVATKG
ncbi:MAG: tetratricopeptide repeat protein [Candidatus Obscuribacterales bacterium]|nr:tetratricopeptide repeat protein [Candidatus Obscuribacterales bacterium]